MAGDDEKATEARLLDTLVANTEALTSLTATISNHYREYMEGKTATRQHANSLSAKVENLDRSIGEMRLAAETAELARNGELKRIYALLTEERQDRRAAVTDGREGERQVQNSERALLREMIQEEVSERRTTQHENRNLTVAAAKEVWKVGGKYIVAGVALLSVGGVMKLTGLNLADILGLAGK